jgi:hypothetical protein
MDQNIKRREAVAIKTKKIIKKHMHLLIAVEKRKNS